MELIAHLFNNSEDPAKVAIEGFPGQFRDIKFRNGAIQVQGVGTAELVPEQGGEVVKVDAVAGDGKANGAISVDPDAVSDEFVRGALGERGVELAVNDKHRSGLGGNFGAQVVEGFGFDDAGAFVAEEEDAIGFHVKIAATVFEVEAFELCAVFDVESTGGEVFGENTSIGGESEFTAFFFELLFQGAKAGVGISILVFPEQADFIFARIHPHYIKLLVTEFKGTGPQWIGTVEGFMFRGLCEVPASVGNAARDQ